MNDLCVNSIVGCRDYSARVVMVMIAQAREASSTARRGQSAAHEAGGRRAALDPSRECATCVPN